MGGKAKLKKIFCKHRKSKIICWHWTHGPNGDEPRFIEVQLKCDICGKYYFIDIKNLSKCETFSKIYFNKEWSINCKPIL